ncbi:hypothetical protein CVT26_008967 [Gymnopilus dilepis]|uniref:Uncharacterized protein n=1 Tax=Gymnopilus dilepis TaxID=231916 RepID=A0A409WCW7_9AGAR|nr:hypothetical protein CVT26_008967 [Gymnopilus dilepis]
MFFTPELLAKRDSGFGLLWLAATLGSRSTFKRLPKRSVLTADISQLCDLISEPEEPLALRLSSNLMFGVVRVYKEDEESLPAVKQEIFLTDVTNCVATLKKVVQEFHSTGATTGDLLMVNSTVRPSAVTIIPDPKGPYELDYDAFVADWHDYLNLGGEKAAGSDTGVIEDGDGDFDPNSNSEKKKRGKVNKAVPQIETVRKEAHTLDENHDYLLSASFDLSFNQDAVQGPMASSSQADATFDNFLPFSDGLDFGDGLGDDLARELGWGLSPAKSARASRTGARQDETPASARHVLNFDNDFALDDIATQPFCSPERTGFPGTPVCTIAVSRGSVKNATPASRKGTTLQHMQPSPATSFSRQFLSQDDDQPLQPLRDITAEERNRQNQGEARKKAKRTRLLLDARTELTDDELKIARAKYLESQRRIRRDLLSKKLEKDSDRLLEELIWGIPKGIQEEGLIHFWQENFKVQVDARSGILRIHDDDEPVAKRRKIDYEQGRKQTPDADIYAAVDINQGEDWNMEWNAPIDVDTGMIVDEPADNRHSSEEPGQARRLSRSASVLGRDFLDFEARALNSRNGSQKSSLFPWDNAGPSSSSGNIPLPDVLDKADTRLGSITSFSRRGSPMAGSQRDSLHAAAISFSPAPVGRGSQIFGEDFAFDVEGTAEETQLETQQETQRSEANQLALERNSHNFLEYAKMQNQTLSERHGRLTLEHVVPRMTSTRHVAAAGFYHCLVRDERHRSTVLATKNLVRLQQPEPYGSVIIDVK